MVRTGKTHNQHHPVPDEDYLQDLLAAGNDGSSQRDGESSEQKANNYRSKHSETEQRRRCKINERFQILKDMIPPNDQKRDKASLLLEVIEYIQFLQEKLKVYEGSYPGWGQEPAKLIPWRGSHAPVENFVDNSQIMKSDSGHENNLVQPMGNEQQSADANFNEASTYRGTEYLSGTDTSAVPSSVALQPSIYPSGTSSLPGENLPSQPLLQSCWGEPSTMERPITGSSSGETGLSDVSSAYSHGLLKNLTQAFQSSGVDLSQASISVQLDIGKRAKPGVAAAASTVEVIQKISPCNRSVTCSEVEVGNDDSIPSAKRLRKKASEFSFAHP
ncbi:hypothetical protein Dimus_034164 [Dionaea muscipula]